MTKRLRLLLVGFALSLCSTYAGASELWVFVLRDDAPAKNIEVQLDGGTARETGSSGRVRFEDLGAGTHRIALRAEGQELYSFRFSNAAQQNADAVVRLPAAGGTAQASVEVYDPRENLSEREGAATGSVIGTVRRADTGAPVPGAVVQVQDTNVSAESDQSGRFQITLPRGVYQLDVSNPQLGVRTSAEVRVVASLNQRADLTLTPEDTADQPGVADRGPIEEMVVIGRYVSDTGAARKRTSQSVLEVIDSEQLARFGDSDIAAALGRSVGVTIEEDKFVFVRGLGGRYTTTSLNGASMASTDPTRRVVPLDMFPSGMLESVSVQKSFAPDMPGDSTGANVQLVTRSYPAEPIREVSVGVKAGSRITGSSVPTDPSSGDLDFLGYDDGERELPILVKGVQAFFDRDLPLPDPPASLVELAGESFNNELDPKFDDAAPDFDFGLQLGDSFELANSELGYLAVLDYSNGWSIQDNGFSQTFRRETQGLVLNSTSDFEKATNTIDINGLFSLGAELGLNHELRAVTMVNRSTFSSARTDLGLNEGADLEFSQSQIEWTERTLVSQSLAGEHFFPAAGDLEVDWRYAYTFADRFSPDRRSVLFQEQREGRGLELEPERGGTERRFEELEDDNQEFNANVFLPFALGSQIDGSAKAGGGIIRRERELEIERFGFRLATNDRSILLDGTATEILGPDNIGPLFVLEDRSEPRDNFDADWDINWGYLMGTLESQRLQFTGGVRVEQSDQVIDTFDAITGQPETVALKQTDSMPSAALTWFMNEGMQLRFAFSKTVARPDFKELSNARFIDPLFDFVVQGNSDLQISDVTNFDLRWEWFFSGQDNLTIALFYKDIEDPIERVFRNISSSAEPDRIFRNQESAEISGLEVNFRKEFALDSSFTQSLFFGANASIIDSEVQLDAQTAVSEDQLERSLQGQADNTLNVQLGYDHLDAGHQVTLLYNRVGDRISEGGGGGLPEVIEEPFHSLDLVYEYSGLRNFVLKSKIRNLLDDSVEFTQGGETFRELDPGVSFDLSVSWRF